MIYNGDLEAAVAAPHGSSEVAEIVEQAAQAEFKLALYKFSQVIGKKQFVLISLPAGEARSVAIFENFGYYEALRTHKRRSK